MEKRTYFCFGPKELRAANYDDPLAAFGGAVVDPEDVGTVVQVADIDFQLIESCEGFVSGGENGSSYFIDQGNTDVFICVGDPLEVEGLGGGVGVNGKNQQAIPQFFAHLVPGR